MSCEVLVGYFPPEKPLYDFLYFFWNFKRKMSKVFSWTPIKFPWITLIIFPKFFGSFPWNSPGILSEILSVCHIEFSRSFSWSFFTISSELYWNTIGIYSVIYFSNFPLNFPQKSYDITFYSTVNVMGTIHSFS